MLPRPLRWRSALRPLALLVAPLTAVSVLAAPAPAADDSPALAPAGAGGGVAAAAPLTTPQDFEAGRYVVVLRDQPAASYTGGVSGLGAVVGKSRSFAPRAARTEAYVDHLVDTQRRVAESVGAARLASYTLTTNGFAADLSAKQAARLSADPRVSAVVENELLHLQDASTSTGYLGLEGDDGVWDSIGGVEEAGKGIVIGIVDTGIAPENPSFAGAELGTADGAEPHLDGDTIVFHKSDGTDFHGVCTTGVQFGPEDCSTKVVGARYFVDGFGAGHIGTPATGEYLSPRDGVDHGSHTASTAAGDADVATGSARISGVTPAARIAVYKACWSGPNPASELDDGCATIDTLAAIDAAVRDGVDVINYSIGGGAAQTTNSITDQAFMRAASAGIFVAAAGGNAGPDSSTLDNASPWVTTVAASTIPASEATVELGDDTTALGASVTVPDGGVSGPLVAAQDVGAGTPDAHLCLAGSLDPAKVRGTIVLCDRGENARLEKSAEVARAGGIGMVLVNPTPDSTDLDAHTIPTVHVDATYFDDLHAYAATPGATATLVAGNQTGEPSVPTPQIAGFSSRGPVLADGSDLIKPDVAAPGVNILAATENPADGAPTWGYMSGTSMASPHVAGLGALYLSTHPHASPAEVKSALMTSAHDTVDADGDPAQDPFAQGNGQVTPTSYLDPGLLYLNDVDDWNGYLEGIGEVPTVDGVDAIDGSDLNLPSIGIGGLAGKQTVTRTVTSTRAGTFDADVTGLDGVVATVQPETLTFAAAGEQHTFTVTFERTAAPLGEFVTGYLDWSDGTTSARSALAVRPVAFDAPAEVAGTGTDGSVDLVARVGDDADVPLLTEGLAHGSRVEGTGTVGGRSHRYAVTVPDSATFLRFDLDAADDAGDLDLTVYRRSASGNVSAVGQSATGSADERLDVTFPTGGTYIVDIGFYAPGSGGSTALDYALTSYVVDPAGPAGDFAVDPALIEGHVGDSPTITASWSGLEPGAYLGVVRFGDTGVSTIVTVDAGADVPVGPGTPELAVSPDATGWVGIGNDLRVTGTGLTPGQTYAAAIDDGTTVRTGTADARGRVDWFVPVTDDVVAGPHTLHLTGPGTDLSQPFRVTPIRIVSAYGFPTTGFDGQAYARIETAYGGHGDLRFEIRAADSGKVFLRREVHVGEIIGVPVISTGSPTAEVDGSELTGTVTVVLADGTDGPSVELEPFTSTPSDPGTITFTPTDDDPDVVDVDVVNPQGTGYSPTVRYYGCDGRQVFASGYLAEAETSTQHWDLTGFTKVVVVDSHGHRLASYAHTGPGRCDSGGIRVTQDYWGTFTATPRNSPTYDARRPITLAMNHRYSPGSSGFDLLVGEGELLSQEPFFEEKIPTEWIETRGPVVTRTMTVPERVALWTSSNWNAYIDPPGIWAQATAWLEVPALTVAELGAPGGPTDPGDPTDPTDPPAPTITPGTATVTGTARVGSVLTASAGGWAPAEVSLTYRWLRDGKPVAAATSATYRLTSADAGHRLAVRVTGALDGADDASVTSTEVRVTGLLTATPKPRLTGRAVVGHRLTVHPGRWKPAPVRLAVAWYRDGRLIRDAHGLRYTLRKRDRDSRITVVVTGRRSGYEDVSRTSSPRMVR